MRRYSTLDFVVKHEAHLMALLHCMGYHLYKQSDSSFMTVFRNLKFKMKLGYECWRQRSQLKDIVVQAIAKTLQERHTLAIASIQRAIYAEDGVPTFSQNSRRRTDQESSCNSESRGKKQ